MTLERAPFRAQRRIDDSITVDEFHMERQQQERFRSRIEKRLQQLEAQLEGSVEDARAISPDPGIGRLSRLDSMQMQQMALDARNRQKFEIQRLKDALGRIDKGIYGTCQICRKDIGHERLEYQPDAVACISCAGGKR